MYEAPCPQRHFPTLLSTVQRPFPLANTQQKAHLPPTPSLRNINVLSNLDVGKEKKLKTRLSFCHLQYQAMFKVYRVTLVALQKAIMYSMKRNGPGRHKSLTQFFFFFFLYFNEFLFLYILHFFYVLTYEHVAKIQKKRREN